MQRTNYIMNYQTYYCLTIVCVTVFWRFIRTISMHDVDHVRMSGIGPKNERGHILLGGSCNKPCKSLVYRANFVAVRVKSGLV